MRYPYRCTENPDHITHRNHPMGQATNDTICEHCGKPARRIFARPAIVVKNSGYTNEGNKAQNTVR